MKKYLLFLLLTTSLHSNPLQNFLETLQRAHGHNLYQKIGNLLKDKDKKFQRKCCYDLLFKPEFLFLKDCSLFLPEIGVTVEILRRRIILYLLVDAYGYEKNFLILYLRDYTDAAITSNEARTAYSWIKTRNICISPNTFYTVDPFYIAFTKMKREEAVAMCRYLYVLGINLLSPLYAREGETSYKNIIEHIAWDTEISVEELFRYLYLPCNMRAKL